MLFPPLHENTVYQKHMTQNEAIKIQLAQMLIQEMQRFRRHERQQRAVWLLGCISHHPLSVRLATYDEHRQRLGRSPRTDTQTLASWSRVRPAGMNGDALKVRGLLWMSRRHATAAQTYPPVPFAFPPPPTDLQGRHSHRAQPHVDWKRQTLTIWLG